MQRNISPVVFCSTANDWVQVHLAQTPLAGQKSLGDVARIATLNILADCWPFFVELAICSKLRYQWLAQELTRLDATVLCLNEVTLSALETLMSEPFVRENYFASEWGDSLTMRSINQTFKKHGCFILSKVPFDSLSAFEWNRPSTRNNREVIVAQLTMCGVPTVVCATHTCHRQKNYRKRDEQIRELKQSLDADPKFENAKALFILGDLNMYSSSEDATILHNAMLDLWAETHFSDTAPWNDSDPGYTFDSDRNDMIPRYIPGHTRRARLDRILMRENSMLKPAAKCTVWANQPVDSDHPEIFPSDHFGLSIDLERATEPTAGNQKAKEVLEKNAEEQPVMHKRSLYSNTVGVGKHCVWLLGRAAGVV
mmetsp:Transcript_40581/g.82992  ORF Transcript_40581/g.82992 Transcript_40581/m.82992 type:complete len:369 (+) Transcript_40581:56-1162(+)